MKTCIAAFLAIAVVIEADASSQWCPTVQLTPYGTECGSGLMNGSMEAQFASHTCVLQIDMSNANTCCNVLLKEQLLIIGFTPIAVGSPQLDPGCLLQVLPAAIVVMPPSGILSAVVPPAPAPTTFYLQGVNVHFTTIGCPPPTFVCEDDYHTTNALQIDVS